MMNALRRFCAKYLINAEIRRLETQLRELHERYILAVRHAVEYRDDAEKWRHARERRQQLRLWRRTTAKNG